MKSISTLLLGSLLACAAGPSSGSEKSDLLPGTSRARVRVERDLEIQNLERARQEAFVRGDVDALDAQTADDYTTINASGRISTKPQMMANLRAGKTRVVRVDLEEMKVRRFGHTAVLTGVYRDSSITDGVSKTVHARFMRIFVKEGGRWRAVAYQQTAVAP
jgi:ketosteroid isomerase-like protein